MITCPLCGQQGYPIIEKRVNGSGWALFVVMLLFCIPLCWLPFVIDGCKDEFRKCSRCGSRIG
ncbi:MAG: LITAF-like zinc ribbon domain-containing protein [Pyrinomonadaceae bacterium]|nr:LITAF-like zinc ribbon domain-containing protein [Pyrinomonadaceae bacterium]